jgi:hypothetical protein
MGITAFVGCINNEVRDTPIIRNGKTCAMTGFGYLNHLSGCEVWSNYYTNFSTRVIGLQEMIDTLKSGDVDKRINILVTEMGDLLDAIGSSQKEILFINSFVRQLGKIGRDIGEVIFYYDCQRFNDIALRLRIHTNTVLIPAKYHMDNIPCYSTKCKKDHKIFVYSYKPPQDDPIKCFNARKIGETTKYDTYEIAKDVLYIPSKKEFAKMLSEDKGVL